MARPCARSVPLPPLVLRSRSAPTPGQFLREVRGEPRKVAWPTKSEVINYSIIVLIAVVLLTAFIAGLDWFFGSVDPSPSTTTSMSEELLPPPNPRPRGARASTRTLGEAVLVDDELLDAETGRGRGRATTTPRPGEPLRPAGPWYVVHTQSGYENKVKQNLEARTRR